MTRPANGDDQIAPQFFLQRLDAEVNIPKQLPAKFAFRDVARWSSERTFIAASVPARLPCGHNLPVLISPNLTPRTIQGLAAWANSFIVDFFVRMTSSGHVTRQVLYRLPSPSRLQAIEERVGESVPWAGSFEQVHAVANSVVAEQFELTPSEYAYLLASFPLVDRDQPPLPHDYRIRATNKGTEWRRISFITRDLALLAYFDYLAGRLEVKPDPERVKRICPDGVPDPPTDLVAFFAEAGVDIGPRTEHAVAATGPFRDLRERVAKAKELGAVAYVPTIDRRRATFVERAAAAGGLSPDEGVLTPEMAARVLRDKADRDFRWNRAMELWDRYPAPHERLESASASRG